MNSRYSRMHENRLALSLVRLSIACNNFAPGQQIFTKLGTAASYQNVSVKCNQIGQL